MQQQFTRALAMILVAAAVGMPSIAAAGIHLKLQTPAPAVAPGDTFVVAAAITIPDRWFNAFDLVVRFDTTRVAFVPTAPLAAQVGSLTVATCASQFHRFNAWPDSAMANLSLLCFQEFITGAGEIYRMKFRALAGTGPTTITIGPGTRFYDGGVSVTPVVGEDVTVMVGSALAATAAVATGGFLLEPPLPNPLRAGGAGTAAFRLPAPATVALELFDTMGRRVARHDIGPAPAGRSLARLAWPALPPGRYELRLRADGRVVGRSAWVHLR
jgi:hypothetical protein